MQEYVGLLIAVARRRIKQAVEARVARRRLSHQQFWILLALHEHPALSQTQLGARIRASAPTVSRILASLLERRLARVEQDPADRRRTRVSLTPAGERLAAELAPVAREIREAVVAGMTETEVASLRRALRTVIANLDALDARAARRSRAS